MRAEHAGSTAQWMMQFSKSKNLVFLRLHPYKAVPPGVGLTTITRIDSGASKATHPED
jgi:hypothetical protein